MNNKNITKNTYRKIPSLKFLYEINPYGIIRNVKSKKVLKTRLDKDGYVVITINIRNERYYCMIHRLVAECYIDDTNLNPDGSMITGTKCINHKDENKLNNYYKNLEWCDIKYNNSYGNRLEKYSNTMTQKLNDFIYYAVNLDMYFNTSREAAEYIKKTYPEYKSSIDTIMRHIRHVSIKGKKFSYKTVWKRITTSID